MRSTLCNPAHSCGALSRRSRQQPLLPAVRQPRLGVGRHPNPNVIATFQNGQYQVEVSLKDISGVPLVTLQKDMPTDYVAPTAAGELTVMGDQRSLLVIRVNRQVVVARPT